MWTAELESRVRWHFDFVHQIENHHSEIIYRRFLKFKWWGGCLDVSKVVLPG